MVNLLAPVTIEIDPGRETARALSFMDQTSNFLGSDAVRYEVTRAVEDRGKDHESEALRAVLRTAADTFTPDDGAWLKKRMYCGREVGSRPLNHS